MADLLDQGSEKVLETQWDCWEGLFNLCYKKDKAQMKVVTRRSWIGHQRCRNYHTVKASCLPWALGPGPGAWWGKGRRSRGGAPYVGSHSPEGVWLLCWSRLRSLPLKFSFSFLCLSSSVLSSTLQACLMRPTVNSCGIKDNAVERKG